MYEAIIGLYKIGVIIAIIVALSLVFG